MVWNNLLLLINGLLNMVSIVLFEFKENNVHTIIIVSIVKVS